MNGQNLIFENKNAPNLIFSKKKNTCRKQRLVLLKYVCWPYYIIVMEAAKCEHLKIEHSIIGLYEPISYILQIHLYREPILILWTQGFF